MTSATGGKGPRYGYAQGKDRRGIGSRYQLAACDCSSGRQGRSPLLAPGSWAGVAWLDQRRAWPALPCRSSGTVVGSGLRMYGCCPGPSAARWPAPGRRAGHGPRPDPGGRQVLQPGCPGTPGRQSLNPAWAATDHRPAGGARAGHGRVSCRHAGGGSRDVLPVVRSGGVAAWRVLSGAVLARCAGDGGLAWQGGLALGGAYLDALGVHFVGLGYQDQQDAVLG